MKPFQKHKAALESGVVGPAFIRGMRAAMHASDRRECGYHTSATSPKIDGDQIGWLLRQIGDNPPRIEAEQSQKGLEWLRDKRRYRKLSDFQRAVVNDFSHFTLAGFEDVGRLVAFFVPVYTVHALNGKQFSYYAGSWQSGVPFTILEVVS